MFRHKLERSSSREMLKDMRFLNLILRRSQSSISESTTRDSQIILFKPRLLDLRWMREIKF